jgi:hypothetical protein
VTLSFEGQTRALSSRFTTAEGGEREQRERTRAIIWCSSVAHSSSTLLRATTAWVWPEAEEEGGEASEANRRVAVLRSVARGVCALVSACAAWRGCIRRWRKREAEAEVEGLHQTLAEEGGAA